MINISLSLSQALILSELLRRIILTQDEATFDVYECDVQTAFETKSLIAKAFDKLIESDEKRHDTSKNSQHSN